MRQNGTLKLFAEEKHFSGVKPSFLAKLRLKAAVKAVDESNYTTTCVVREILK